MEGTGQQRARLTASCIVAPLPQPVQHLLLLPVRQQIQRHRQPLAASGDGTGDIKNRRAADAVLGEQHLTPVLCQHLAASVDGDARLGLHALQGPGVGGIGLDLHQRGIQRRAVMPQPLCQLIAVHNAAYLAACRAARRKDHPVGGKFFTGFGANKKNVAFFADTRYRTGGMQVNSVVFQREPQHIQHAAGHVAEGIYPPAVLCRGEQPQSGKAQ